MLGEFITVFAIATLFTLMLVNFSEELGLMDHPNSRSSHLRPTPRSGGVGIFAALMTGTFVFDAPLLFQYPLLFAALALVFAVGLADDRFEVSPKMKFYVIFLATALAVFEGFEITTIGTYFGADLALGWFAIPFTLFAVAGFTNALNLIDGIDMLAGTVATIILLTLAYIGYQNGDALLLHLSMGTVAGIMGFLVFNAHPARIFMGDSGALTLGFIISMLSVRALHYVDPTVIFFIAMVPILDTLIVMVRRIRRGTSPFAPDKTHMHHVIMRLKRGNVSLSVLIIGAIQLSFSLIGLELADNEPFINLLIFGLVLFTFYTLFTVRVPQTETAHEEHKRRSGSFFPFLKRRG